MVLLLLVLLLQVNTLTVLTAFDVAAFFFWPHLTQHVSNPCPLPWKCRVLAHWMRGPARYISNHLHMKFI